MAHTTLTQSISEVGDKRRHSSRDNTVGMEIRVEKTIGDDANGTRDSKSAVLRRLKVQ